MRAGGAPGADVRPELRPLALMSTPGKGLDLHVHQAHTTAWGAGQERSVQEGPIPI